MTTITLPDKSTMEVENGTSVIKIAESIGPRLAKDAVAGRINGLDLVDTDFGLDQDCEIEIITTSSEEGLDILRHSTSHVMAAAVKRLFENAKFAIGPSIENGFYYDFDIGRPFTEDDVASIEAEMKQIIKDDEKFERIDKPRETALKELQKQGEDYKAELLEEIEDDTVSFYTMGSFTDLCRGPHLPSTGYISSFKLLNIAGAYWRGDPSNPMLQRIYGTAFFSAKELEEHLENIEIAKERDHRKIGKELDLFSFHEQAPGLPFWHPNGMIIYNEIITFWREVHKAWGYSEIQTPMILNEELWHLSGHWDNYKENMYFTEIDGLSNAVKPMNCPGGLLVFGNKLHSYRDFPMRIAELGKVYRHELSGVLHGLFRVRAFTQDDAHIFCTPDQIENEIIGVLKLYIDLYAAFGLTDYRLELSTRPDKSIGSDEIWDVSEKALKSALEQSGNDYELNPGDGAFYGPKIDFHIQDCMKRSWQCGTIQLDFSMPQRFAEAGLNITYVDEHNDYKTPVMIHRAALGSLERFIGILIEEYGGKFPLWLAPVQAAVMPITDSHKPYAQDITDTLVSKGFRAVIDDRSEKLGYKVREAIVKKIPYILVVGNNEIENNTVTVRHIHEDDLGAFPREEFFAKLKEEHANRMGSSIFSVS
ncbi:threonine--tRNA ligase [Planctomycetota bacterium]